MLVAVWLSLTRDLIVAAVGRADLAPSRELAPELESLAERIGSARFVRMAALLERIDGGLREAASPKLALEAAMLAWPLLPQPRDR